MATIAYGLTQPLDGRASWSMTVILWMVSIAMYLTLALWPKMRRSGCQDVMFDPGTTLPEKLRRYWVDPVGRQHMVLFPVFVVGVAILYWAGYLA